MNAAVTGLAATETQPAGVSNAAHLLINTICSRTISPRRYSAWQAAAGEAPSVKTRHFPLFQAFPPPDTAGEAITSPERVGVGGQQFSTFPFKCLLNGLCEGSRPPRSQKSLPALKISQSFLFFCVEWPFGIHKEHAWMAPAELQTESLSFPWTASPESGSILRGWSLFPPLSLIFTCEN